MSKMLPELGAALRAQPARVPQGEMDQRFHPQPVGEASDESYAAQHPILSKGADIGSSIANLLAQDWRGITGLFAGHTGEVLPITKQAMEFIDPEGKRGNPVTENLVKIPEQMFNRAQTYFMAPWQAAGALGSGIAKAIQGDYTAPFTEVARAGETLGKRLLTGDVEEQTPGEESASTIVKELGPGDIPGVNLITKAITGGTRDFGTQTFKDIARNAIKAYYPPSQNWSDEELDATSQGAAELGYMLATDPSMATGAIEGVPKIPGFTAAEKAERVAKIAKLQTAIGVDATKAVAAQLMAKVKEIPGALKEAHGKMMANPRGGGTELPIFGGGGEGVPRPQKPAVELPPQPGDLFHKPAEEAPPLEPTLKGAQEDIPGQAPIGEADEARQVRFEKFLSSRGLTQESFEAKHPAERRGIMAQFTNVEPMPMVPLSPEGKVEQAIGGTPAPEAAPAPNPGGDRAKIMSAKSKGHIAFIGNFEYYKDAQGNLYRAPLDNVIDMDTGNRIGRFEATPAQADAVLRFAIQDAAAEALAPTKPAAPPSASAPAPEQTPAARVGATPPPPGEAAGAGAGDEPTGAPQYSGPERRVENQPVDVERRAHAQTLREQFMEAERRNAEREGRPVDYSRVPDSEQVERDLQDMAGEPSTDDVDRMEREGIQGDNAPEEFPEPRVEFTPVGELAFDSTVTSNGVKYTVEAGAHPGVVRLVGDDGSKMEVSIASSIPIDADSHVMPAGARTIHDIAFEEHLKDAGVDENTIQQLARVEEETKAATRERVLADINSKFIAPDNLIPNLDADQRGMLTQLLRSKKLDASKPFPSLKGYFIDKQMPNIEEYLNRVPRSLRGVSTVTMDQAAHLLEQAGGHGVTDMDEMGEYLNGLWKDEPVAEPPPKVRSKTAKGKAVESVSGEAPPEEPADVIQGAIDQGFKPPEPPAVEPPKPPEPEPPPAEPPRVPPPVGEQPPGGEPPGKPPRPPYPTGPWRKELTSRAFEALGTDIASDPETVALLRNTEAGRHGAAGGDDWTADAIYEAYQKSPAKFPGIDAIRAESGMSVKDFADEVLMSSSESGRRLNYLSVARGQILGSIEEHVKKLVSETEPKNVVITDGKTGKTVIRGTAKDAHEAIRMASGAKPGDHIQIVGPPINRIVDGPKPPLGPIGPTLKSPAHPIDELPGVVQRPSVDPGPVGETLRGRQGEVLPTPEGPKPPAGPVGETLRGRQGEVIPPSEGPKPPPGGVHEPTIRGIQETAPGVLETRTETPSGPVGETIRPVPPGMQPNLPGTEGPRVHFDGTIEDFLGRNPTEQNDLFTKKPEVLKALRELDAAGNPPLTNRQKWLNGGATTPGLQWWPGYRRLSNAARTAMTLTIKNLTRNFLTQGMRIGIGDSIEAAVETWMAKKFGGDVGAWDRQARILEKLPEMLTPKGRAAIDDMMRVMPKLEEKLGNTMLEVPGGKTGIFSKLYHYTVGVQERFYRRAVVAGTLEHLAFTEGFDTAVAGRKLVGQEAVEYMRAHPMEALKTFGDRAVDAALDATWASNPKPGTWGSDILKAFEKNPELYMIAPYPRFYMNGVRYMWDRNPLQLTRLLMPGGEVSMFSKTADKVARAKMIGRAVQGSVALGAGLYLVSNYAGSNWHSLKVGGKEYDFAGYSPLSSALFHATLVKKAIEAREDVRKSKAQGKPLDGFTAFKDRVSDMTARDMLQGFAPINSISGTPLVLFQPTPSKHWEEWMTRKVFSVLGNFLGGFTTPIRSVRDLVTGVSGEDEEKERRATFSGPEALGAVGSLVGPLLGNTPYAQQLNAPMPSPFQADVPTSDYPLTGQLTGVNKSDADTHPIAYWARKLGFSPGEYAVHTGIPQVDREATAMIGKVAERAMRAVIEQPNWDKFTPALQRKLFDEKMSKIANSGRKFYIASHPEFKEAIAKEQIPDNLRAALQGVAIEKQRRVEEKAGAK